MIYDLFKILLYICKTKEIIMAIVHMHKRVERFMQQLDLTDERIYPEPQFFDYEEKSEVYKYDEEETITLRDFQIEFGLILTQTGVYNPGDHCQPSEFTVENTELEIEDLTVFDNVYGEDLRFNREEFTEVINKVKDLIVL